MVMRIQTDLVTLIAKRPHLIWTEKVMRVEDIDADPKYYLLSPCYHNKYFQQLKEDIRQKGIRQPLVVAYKNHFLEDGYHRLKALKELGIETVRVYHGTHPSNKIRYDIKNQRFVEDP